MAKGKAQQFVEEVMEAPQNVGEPPVEEPQQPSLDEVVDNTRVQIADTINRSGLPLSIIRLILENLIMQCK